MFSVEPLREKESEAECVVLCEAEAEAKRISDAIDEELQRQAKELKRAPKPVKILLLGELSIFQWTITQIVDGR